MTFVHAEGSILFLKIYIYSMLSIKYMYIIFLYHNNKRADLLFVVSKSCFNNDTTCIERILRLLSEDKKKKK